MIKGRVSVVIPSRRERWLQQTIDDLFSKAAGDIEVIAVHDGTWPDPPLKDHPKLTVIHYSDCRGMRNGINSAIRIATGEYIMKSDGHCLYSEAFDELLKADCDKDWLVVPRRYSLDVENWCIMENKKHAPVDYHYLSYPFERVNDVACGLHGTLWRERAKERAHILVDDEMSSQGSCYFLHRDYWDRIGPLDDVNYGTFAQEFQEVGMKVWLGGGRVVINKKLYYAHLHKGKQYGTGYGFSNKEWEAWAAQNKRAHDYTIHFWMNDLWEKRIRNFEWLIEKFWPVPSWPQDWQEQVREHLAKGVVT